MPVSASKLMPHFYEDSMFEEGFFTYPQLYTEIVQLFPTNSHFVEIGSWKGRSAAFMAVEINNSGKSIKFDCVDTWKGSLTEDVHQNDSYVKSNTLYEKFLSNTEKVKHIITPIQEESVDAAKLYADKSLDFVFIDGDHRYECVVEDIKSWLPKIKHLGVLAGHDYGWCIDVRKAVHDVLGAGAETYTDRYEIGYKSYDDGRGEGCWVFQVEYQGENDASTSK